MGYIRTFLLWMVCLMDVRDTVLGKHVDVTKIWAGMDRVFI